MSFSTDKLGPAYRPINQDHVALLISKGIAANQRYPYTLGSYMRLHFSIPDELIQNVIQKIKELHEAGFYHGDLHAYNIVFDHNYEVRLIDFETLRTMDELKQNQSEIDILYEFLKLNYTEYERTLDDLIKFEFKFPFSQFIV